MSATVNRSKTDTNQTRVVKALRAAGCEVQSLASIGNGCPDLLVATGDSECPLKVLEVKDGDKPPSQRRLTDDEIKWHKRWNMVAPGAIWVVYDEVGALWVCGKTNEIPEIKPIRLVE